eukprot:4558863-Amphidinium_carterae.1
MGGWGSDGKALIVGVGSDTARRSMKRVGEALDFEFRESSFWSAICPKCFWEEDPFLREVSTPKSWARVGTSTLAEEAPVHFPPSVVGLGSGVPHLACTVADGSWSGGRWRRLLTVAL